MKLKVLNQKLEKKQNIIWVWLWYGAAWSPQKKERTGNRILPHVVWKFWNFFNNVHSNIQTHPSLDRNNPIVSTSKIWLIYKCRPQMQTNDLPLFL